LGKTEKREVKRCGVYQHHRWRRYGRNLPRDVGERI
jgi:hypothetical protein